MGINPVANIEIASVTQKTAINEETAAALMANGFMFSGAGIKIRTRNNPMPKTKPTF